MEADDIDNPAIKEAIYQYLIELIDDDSLEFYIETLIHPTNRD